MAAKAMAPKLRFKEFTSDWALGRVGEFASKIGSGSTPSGGERSYVPNGIPFIRSQNVTNNELNLDGIKFINESLNSKMSGTIVKKGDLLLNITGASIGRSCVVPNSFEVGNVNQHVCIIRLKDWHNPYFYQPYIASDRGQQMILSTQVGGGREGLNFQSIRAFEIWAPKYDEQTKIANFLTAVDTKISQLTKKHELLTLYKKGVMQKIFNRELRFKDDEGREFPEWKDSKLFDIAPLQRGFDLPVSNIKKGKFPVVFSNGILKHHYEFKVHGPGVVTGRSGTIGKVTFVEQDFWPHNTSLWVTDFKNNAPKFIYYLYCYLDLSKFGTGSGVPTLNRNDVHRENTYVPQTQGEQTKIANFLTAIDDKITNVKSQLEAAKEYKQGLLQQMFV